MVGMAKKAEKAERTGNTDTAICTLNVALAVAHYNNRLVAPNNRSVRTI